MRCERHTCMFRANDLVLIFSRKCGRMWLMIEGMMWERSIAGLFLPSIQLMFATLLIFISISALLWRFLWRQQSCTGAIFQWSPSCQNRIDVCPKESSCSLNITRSNLLPSLWRLLPVNIIDKLHLRGRHSQGIVF